MNFPVTFLETASKINSPYAAVCFIVALVGFGYWRHHSLEPKRRYLMVAGFTLVALIAFWSVVAIATPAVAKTKDKKSNNVSATISVPDSNGDANSKQAHPTKAVNKRVGDNNTVINAPVPENMGSGNTIVGATDANGNTIFNKGGTAIGNGACADSTSIAIGANAGAGNCATPTTPPQSKH